MPADTITLYGNTSLQVAVQRVLQRCLEVSLQPYGLTSPYWTMLEIIFAARDGVRQTEVAKQLQVKPPLVTVMVRELEAKDLIVVMANQFDSRAKLLAITPNGKKTVKAIRTQLQTVEAHLLHGLSEAELQVYHKVLQTITTQAMSV